MESLGIFEAFCAEMLGMARLLGLHSQNCERLTPWLEMTGWITHLGSFPLLPLALSVTLPNIMHVDTPVWMATILDRVAEAFTIWAAAEHAILTEPMHCTLTLLKSCKRHANLERITPHSVPQPNKPPAIAIGSTG